MAPLPQGGSADGSSARSPRGESSQSQTAKETGGPGKTKDYLQGTGGWSRKNRTSPEVGAVKSAVWS